MLDLHRLRILRELKYRGTLAAVATAMSFSPSAVSQQLAQLEVEAGTKLLEPVGRGVRLTAQAEILVGHTEVLLERLELAEAELAASLTEISATLRVAAYQSIALTAIPEVLTALQELHPQLRVEVSQLEPETAVPALLARDFDLVLTEEYPDHPMPRTDRIEQTLLYEDSLLILQGTGRARATRLSDLADRPWVMEPAGMAPRVWLTTMCRNAGFEPDVRFESSDLAMHVRLAESGHAIAMVPELALRGLRSAAVGYPIPQAPSRRRILTAVRSGAGQNPAVQAFRDALASALSLEDAGGFNPETGVG